MTQSTIQRIAYTAVGIPVLAVSALSDRLSEARSTLEASAEKLSASARDDIDRWASKAKNSSNA